MIIRAYPLGEEISISNRNLQTISVADKIKSWPEKTWDYLLSFYHVTLSFTTDIKFYNSITKTNNQNIFNFQPKV